jgi:hypothetical protein
LCLKRIIFNGCHVLKLQKKKKVNYIISLNFPQTILFFKIFRFFILFFFIKKPIIFKASPKKNLDIDFSNNNNNNNNNNNDDDEDDHDFSYSYVDKSCHLR